MPKFGFGVLSFIGVMLFSYLLELCCSSIYWSCIVLLFVGVVLFPSPTIC